MKGATGPRGEGRGRLGAAAGRVVGERGRKRDDSNNTVCWIECVKSSYNLFGRFNGSYYRAI